MTYLFLHGLGQSAASWDRVLGTLHCEGETLCPELSGFLQDGPCSYAVLYQAFSAYCDGVSGPVSLCGLSLGGMLAMQYAIERPERVSSLVLIGTQYTTPKRLLRVQNAVFRVMPKRAFAGAGFQKADFIRLCGSMAELDFQDALVKIVCPALVVCGERDRANRPAALGLKERLPAGELCILKGAGHEVNVDAPEALGAVLHAFWK